MMAEIVFKNQAASEAMIEAWTAIFSHAEIQAEDVGRGFAEVLKTSKFFPKPAEVIAAIRGDAESQAEIAFERARQLVREHGGDASFTLSDFDGDGHALFAFAETLDRIRVMTSEDRNLVAAEFRRVYRVAKATGSTCARIVGTFERSNTAHGFDPSRPELVGRPAADGVLPEPAKELPVARPGRGTGDGFSRFKESAAKLGLSEASL